MFPTPHKEHDLLQRPEDCSFDCAHHGGTRGVGKCRGEESGRALLDDCGWGGGERRGVRDGG